MWLESTLQNLVLDFDLNRKYNDFIKTTKGFIMRPVEQIIEDIEKAQAAIEQGKAKLSQATQELTTVYTFVGEKLGFASKQETVDSRCVLDM